MTQGQQCAVNPWPYVIGGASVLGLLLLPSWWKLLSIVGFGIAALNSMNVYEWQPNAQGQLACQLVGTS